MNNENDNNNGDLDHLLPHYSGYTKEECQYIPVDKIMETVHACSRCNGIVPYLNPTQGCGFRCGEHTKDSFERLVREWKEIHTFKRLERERCQNRRKIKRRHQGAYMLEEGSILDF